MFVKQYTESWKMKAMPLAFLLVVSLLGVTTEAQMKAATTMISSYKPICKLYKDPPPQGWKRWSQKSTWKNGVIPGISGKLENVTIPCNTGIILDVSLKLDQLVINGWLKVVDKGPFYVNANFVIVQGKLTIGTNLFPYTGKIIFTLTNGGYEYKWKRAEGSGNVGFKAFAVIGGSVEFNGMYKNQRSWAMLTKTAKKGDYQIQVSGDVSAWPVGGRIAIASTDYNYRQAEDRKITYIKKVGRNTIIGLEYGLFYNHWGVPIYTGVRGRALSEIAEVALLDRTIVIQGSKEKDPLIGGHFIVFETSTIQKIKGVEFTNMGQQGKLGRYPVHFHLSRNVFGSSVTKISVHHTNQRCVVVHGSFNLRIERNVAYMTKGHCFVLEDGIESGNVFYRNLGFSTEKAVRLINSTETNAHNTDDIPSTFWISNANNTFIANVAAGSEDTGFWFQADVKVLGPSVNLPEAKGVYPKFAPFGPFISNIGHSNLRGGFRTFAFGLKPRVSGGKAMFWWPQNEKPQTGLWKNLVAYKNGAMGVLLRKADSIIVDGGIFADNRIGQIEVHDAQNITIRNAIILGETINVGNPSDCNNPKNYKGNCEPLYGCTLPVDPKNARSLGGGLSIRDAPMYGILIDQMEFPSEGLTEYSYSQGAPYPIHITNVAFGKFSNRCKVGAAIGGDGFRNWQIYSGGHRSEKLKFLDKSPRIYFSPQYRGLQGNYDYKDSGPTSQFKIFRDLDGTLMGGKGGYFVTNNKVILPQNLKLCKPIYGGYYAWACPGVCYRTVGFYASNYQSPKFTISRTSDGASMTFPGYVNTFPNFLARTSYDVQMTPAPKWIQISYADPYGCTEPATFNLVLPNGYYWKFGYINKGKCLGNPNGPECQITYSSICGYGGQKSKLKVTIGGSTNSKVAFNLAYGKYPGC